jgi:hypothetical protein
LGHDFSIQNLERVVFTLCKFGFILIIFWIHWGSVDFI